MFNNKKAFDGILFFKQNMTVIPTNLIFVIQMS